MTCKCGKFGISCVLIKCRCQCRYERKWLLLSIASTPETTLNASGGRWNAEGNWKESFLVSFIVQGDWMEQTWLAGDKDYAFCEEFSKKRGLRHRF